MKISPQNLSKGLAVASIIFTFRRKVYELKLNSIIKKFDSWGKLFLNLLLPCSLVADKNIPAKLNFAGIFRVSDNFALIAGKSGLWSAVLIWRKLAGGQINCLSFRWLGTDFIHEWILKRSTTSTSGILQNILNTKRKHVVNYPELLREIEVADEECADLSRKDFLTGYLKSKVLPTRLFQVCDSATLNKFPESIQNGLRELDFSETAHLVHNDLNAENIFVQENLNVFVIDYKWRRFGDSLKDLSKILRHFRRNPN